MLVLLDSALEGDGKLAGLGSRDATSVGWAPVR